MSIFETAAVDREVFDRELGDFLPDRIIDVHTHVWLDRHKRHAPEEHARTVSWPSLVAKECSIEDLEKSFAVMFPGRRAKALIFSSISRGDDVEAMNAYIAESGRSRGHPTLMYAFPEWSAKDLERKLRAGRFLGVKVYLNLTPAYLPRQEIRIFDFLPPHQLDVLDRGRRVVMLHIPRDGRLRDPVNLAQMLEIERNWPRVRLIIAHVGRAYCDEDMGDAFERLSATKDMVFDFAANTNAAVFERAIRTFGPERCLFGSDLPITWMRMRRICEGGRYVNLVPRGKYGDVSRDPNMREVDGEEAARLTTFMYEELLSIKRACTRAGVDKRGVEAIFRTNAERVLGWRMP
jgi:uncharacterized protein